MIAPTATSSLFEKKYMRRAIELGKQSAFEQKSGGPFGAVIVHQGHIIAEGRNRVVETNDPTWHAEMDAIRQASTYLQQFKLVGCVLYTSSEPCPMCLSACYWAGLDTIFYASTVQDAFEYGNFDDSFIYKELKQHPSQRTIPSYPLLREEALPVWDEYKKLSDRVQY